MPGSEANSAATGSPLSARPVSWCAIIADRMPRRRWVGSTLTNDTPATGSGPPGTVIRKL